MMSRLPKIDKKSADPELLQQYKDARNERRSEWLWWALPIITLVCVLGVFALVIFQPSPEVVGAVSLVGIALIFGLLLFVALWSNHKVRRVQVAFVFGALAFCAFAAWFWGWLEGKIFT